MRKPQSRPAPSAGRWARLVAMLGCLALSACASLADRAREQGADAVTQWTRIADAYGNGLANWRTLAIMHQAMHDALNAARPVYARWQPALPDEPPADGAEPAIAMAAAAHAVLLRLHPERASQTERAFAAVLAGLPEGAGRAAGLRLGDAIGEAAVRRREADGSGVRRDFIGSETVGLWRPTLFHEATSLTENTHPFLFASAEDWPAHAPPVLGSPRYLRDLDESARLGRLTGSDRTAEQTTAALFWAFQSSQRGFVDLAVRMLAEAPPPGGLHAEARLMAQLTAALADSAILVWHEKERVDFWRPITAIRAAAAAGQGGPGWAGWLPLVETPPFPEYPSGHAADCYTGAGVLAAAFPGWREPILYRASGSITLGPAPDDQGGGADAFGMGQHAQQGESPGGTQRQFQSLAAAATECSLSRIWAGAHFRAADDEAERLAGLIVQRALAATPAVALR